MPKTNRDYVAIVYNERERPLTIYPAILASYLFERFNLKPGNLLLDVGCGRGEFLRGFIQCGVVGHGVDQSPASLSYCPEASFKACDIQNDELPYPDDFFDVVYSKSVIEHFYYPEKVIKEVYRVLKPGGKVITLCPDWYHNFRIYFEDYTHRTPFMKASLRDIFLINSFENVTVEHFRQLPILWGVGKVLLPLAELTRLLFPPFLKPFSKWVRFSKEVMLLAYATKPLSELSNDGKF